MKHWDPLGPDGMDHPKIWPEPEVVMVVPGHDLFGGDVERSVIEEVVSCVQATPRHGYLLLTTCAKRLLALGNEGLVFPRNLWLGVSVEADEHVWRVEDLLRCNTAQAWVSVDPIRGPVPSLPVGMLDWVVCGAAREPAHLEVARDLRDRCSAAGVPFRYRRLAADGAIRLPPLDGRVWDESPPGLSDRLGASGK